MAKSKAPTLGEMIDSLYQKREQRIAAQRVADGMKAEEMTIKQSIVEKLQELNAESMSGKMATASIKTSVVPKVADWQKLYAYIHKNKAFELLHQRISSTAWSELVDSGKSVPGVDEVELTDLSLTKSKR